ncbi:MAG: 2-amino-4-hydroxy-6-hydroxymethyldihydropteridine diphosphokinase [Burkholderiaceae bacterium]|nr:2-amino-4-hydroxy-6-hydroxymethyldihydropteridine diphosphokinase [Burkholderiaceae bacterium]
MPTSGTAAATVWIGLGANLGQCAPALRRALQAVHALPGTRVLRASSLYRSAPVDSSGPDYLNAVAEIATVLAPQALLQALQTIEWAAGRERPYRNAPRTLDLDILFFGDEQIATATLMVPHPRIYERAFVLCPLAELAPERVTPEQLQAVQHQRVERTPTLDGLLDGLVA